MIKQKVLYFILLLVSYKSRIPVKSVPIVYILASGELIDETEMLATAFLKFRSEDSKLGIIQFRIVIFQIWFYLLVWELRLYFFQLYAACSLISFES